MLSRLWLGMFSVCAGWSSTLFFRLFFAFSFWLDASNFQPSVDTHDIRRHTLHTRALRQILNPICISYSFGSSLLTSSILHRSPLDIVHPLSSSIVFHRHRFFIVTVRFFAYSFLSALLFFSFSAYSFLCSSVSLFIYIQFYPPFHPNTHSSSHSTHSTHTSLPLRPHHLTLQLSNSHSKVHE